MIRIVDPNQLGHIITQLREMNRLTQRGLAVEAGHRQGQVSAWELGKVFPTLVPLIDVANALGYDLALVPLEDDE